MASLVVLADDHPNWRPRRFAYELWGSEAGLKFPSVKLLDFEANWEMLENSRNPFSVVVMAHLQHLATRRDSMSRLQQKFRLFKMLFKRGYSRKDIAELFRFIDGAMVLPEELAARFSEMVFRYEKEMGMPYVTSIERQGIKKGLLQGLERGRFEIARKRVLDVLEIRFGTPPAASIAKKVNQIEDSTALAELFKDAMTVMSPNEFQRILETKSYSQRGSGAC